MFGIFNAAFRVATRSDTWPDSEGRGARSVRDWFHNEPRNPRTGLRPGESWTDRP